MSNTQAKCKYCREIDFIDEMHRDINTKEYYHQRCQPKAKKGSKDPWV